MAINTEAKRRSKVPPLWVLPLADGSVSQADRQHKGLKYAGIAATAAATGFVSDSLDITEAFRAALRGEHSFSDAVRARAVLDVRSIAGDRIYAGRAPQRAKRPYVLLAIADVERNYYLNGECDYARSLVEVSVYSPIRRQMFRLWDAVRRCFTSMQENITTQDGTLYVGGCTLEAESEPPPEEPVDAGERYIHWYQGFFRTTHEIRVPGEILAPGPTTGFGGIGYMQIEVDFIVS